eukprot:scaffold314163_cov22-Prasinocladus_malaysianus.AAC.1
MGTGNLPQLSEEMISCNSTAPCSCISTMDGSQNISARRGPPGARGDAGNGEMLKLVLVRQVGKRSS